MSGLQGRPVNVLVRNETWEELQLDALALDRECRERNQRKGARGGDSQGVHRCARDELMKRRPYAVQNVPSAQRNSRIDERNTAKPSAVRENGVRPAPLSWSS